MLLLLNGAPGVGKSALAERYARDHALALLIDIDDLRRRLGRWESTEASKSVARDLAVVLARAHLGEGYDVLVPQFVGRREFVERLRGVADDAGARFVEVVLTDDPDAIAARFRQRRTGLVAEGVRHPEADLRDVHIDAEIRAANDALCRDALARDLPLIPAGEGIDATFGALAGVLATL